MVDDFYGLPASRLANPHLRLDYLTTAGPRLVRLYFGDDGKNLLAEVPEEYSETPYGRFYIRGGHRLWHAPETVVRSYIPDNECLSVTSLPNGVRLTADVEPGTGIQKQLTINLHPNQPRVTLNHELTNQGLWDVELAAWSLTMMVLRGTAILPQTQDNVDSDGLQPNRNLVLWPYTHWQDPRLSLNDDYVLVEGRSLPYPAKIGALTRRGWLGYRRGDVLFTKQFTPQPTADHVDFGCNCEIYVNDEFLELETLSPLTRLAPGTTLVHTEIWTFTTGWGTADTLTKLRERATDLNRL